MFHSKIKRFNAVILTLLMLMSVTACKSEDTAREEYILARPDTNQSETTTSTMEQPETESTTSVTNTEYTVTFEDFSEKTIGLVIGEHIDFSEVIFRDMQCELVYYSDFETAFDDLLQGNINGALKNEYAIKNAIKYRNMGEYVSYYRIPESYWDTTAWITSKENDVLREQLNAFITKCAEDGTLQTLEDRWLNNYTETTKTTMTALTSTGENGTLRIASLGSAEPFFFFFEDQEYEGLDAELIIIFCNEYNYTPEYTIAEYSSVLPLVQSGKADVGIGGFSFTEERAEYVNFTETINDIPVAIAYVKDDYYGDLEPAETIAMQ